MAPVDSVLLLVRGSALYSEIRVGKVTSPVSFNQDVKALIPSKDVDPDFLLYFLMAKRAELLTKVHSAGNGAGVLETNLLKGLEFPLPTLPEQRAIARGLKAFDELIATNEKLVDQLWGLGQVHYERVVRGSRSAPLKEILSLRYGKPLPEKVRVEGSVPVASSAGITGWHNEALVKGPGVIVGRKGTVGKVTWVERDFFPIDTCFYVQSDYPLVWCYFLTKNAGLENKNSDSAVPGLNRETALASLVPYVDRELAQRESKVLQELVATAGQLEVENSELIQARDLLLPALVSGEITLNSAAKQFEVLGN